MWLGKIIYMSINTLWRTLIRIETFDENSIQFIIPGWDHEVTLFMNRSELPEEINENLEKVKLPYRLHVRCNIGNDNKDELIFENWEKF